VPSLFPVGLFLEAQNNHEPQNNNFAKQRLMQISLGGWLIA